ncbi:MAG: M28 family peptidase, partial [Gemmatimonadales bacterium]
MRNRSLVLVLLSALVACSGSKPGNSPVPSGDKVVWPDEGPRTWAPRPTEAAITANDLRTRLYQLADDSMMGREAGTLGNFKGTEYIAREFKRLGLQPGGDNGTWFQELPLGPTGYELAQSRLAVGGVVLAPMTEWVPTAPSALNGLAAKFTGDNLPTVFGGRWGDTTVVLDPALLRGKVVVFLPAATTAAATGTRGTTAVRDTRAQSAGAAAVLVASVDGMNRALLNGVFAGRIAMKPATLPGGASTTGGANISLAAATKIFGKPLDQLSIGATGQAVGGAWSYEWRMSKYPGRNVIAILPGTDPTLRGTYVLIGAHNDHIGMNAAAPDHDSLRAYNRIIRPQGANDAGRTPTATEQHLIDSMIARARSIRPIRRDSVNNGADDDGSGTVVLLEIAERFATQTPPRRSMIFISHVGEEKGLLGSRWFVDHPTVPLDSIVAAHNMDMLGKGRVT